MERKLEEEVFLIVQALNRDVMNETRNAYLDSFSGEVLPENTG